MAANDLTALLAEWPYDPEATVRIVTATDGRALLQVRLPLGIEQYELTGRPDGHRPRGFETVLARVEHELREHIVARGGDAGFEISTETAGELQAEGVLFYSRYVLLFQMNRHAEVVRDTQHNLHLCDILERYCPDEEARNAVLQFRPYILRMNGAARAMGIAAGELSGDIDAVIANTIATISGLEEIQSPAFQFERVRSANYLGALRKRLGSESGEATDPDRRSMSGGVDTETELERLLREAIADEDYERAATIRDQLRDVRGD